MKIFVATMTEGNFQCASITKKMYMTSSLIPISVFPEQRHLGSRKPRNTTKLYHLKHLTQWSFGEIRAAAFDGAERQQSAGQRGSFSRFWLEHRQ